MINRPKVMIGTPMINGQCTFGYVAGLIDTIIDFNSYGIDYMYNFHVNDSLITRARNYIANIFLNSDCTHLCFIDSDIHFPGDAIRKMLHTNYELICAPYPKKMIDWNAVYNVAKNSKDGELDLSKSGSSYVINRLKNDSQTIDNNNTVKVSHAGTGFMLISRKVFNDLKPYVEKIRNSSVKNNNNYYSEFFKTSINDSDVLLSEDYHFCDLYRSIGGNVHLKLDIELNHMGAYIFKGDINKYGPNIT